MLMVKMQVHKYLHNITLHDDHKSYRIWHNGNIFNDKDLQYEYLSLSHNGTKTTSCAFYKWYGYHGNICTYLYHA